MRITGTQISIVVNHQTIETLEFLLEGKLNNIMSGPVSPAGVLFTIEPMVTKVILLLATGTDGAQKSRGRNGQAKKKFQV